jgi:hypothetical protein
MVLAALLSPMLVFSSLLSLLIVAYITIITQMIRTGKIKAKGAKKCRREAIPIFYKKNSKSYTH